MSIGISVEHHVAHFHLHFACCVTLMHIRPITYHKYSPLELAYDQCQIFLI